MSHALSLPLCPLTPALPLALAPGFFTWSPPWRPRETQRPVMTPLACNASGTTGWQFRGSICCPGQGALCPPLGAPAVGWPQTRRSREMRFSSDSTRSSSSGFSSWGLRTLRLPSCRPAAAPRPQSSPGPSRRSHTQGCSSKGPGKASRSCPLKGPPRTKSAHSPGRATRGSESGTLPPRVCPCPTPPCSVLQALDLRKL